MKRGADRGCCGKIKKNGHSFVNFPLLPYARRRSRLAGLLPAVAVVYPLLVPNSAHADYYLHFWENQHRPNQDFRIVPEISLFSTSQNYDATGASVVPTGLASYTRIQTDVLAGFGISSRLTVWGRAGWANINVDHSTVGGKSFGLTDQSLGAVFRLFESSGNKSGTAEGFSLDLQAQVDLPAYSNNSAATTGVPFHGDGSIDMTGGAFLNVPFAQTKQSYWLVSAGAGFTYRTGGFSQAIPWSGTLRYSRMGEGLIFGASVFGLQSLNTDLSNPTTRSPVAAGGSDMVNAINPSLLTIRAQLGYQFNPLLGLQFTAFQSVSGTNAPSTRSYMVGLIYHLEQTHPGGNPTRMSGPEYGRSNQGLITYTFDAKVLKANDRLNLVKIDKGSQDGVAVGQIFDIFSVKKDGSIVEAIARAKCQSVSSGEAVLNVVEYFKEVWIEEGFIVKKPVQ